MPKGTQILTTGLLRKSDDTAFATVDVVNLDPNNQRTVTVRMIDWSSGSPIDLLMFDPSTQTLPPNRAVSFRSQPLFPTIRLYEVRIIHPEDDDVVTNVFGIGGSINSPAEGNTVLQHDLVKIKLK